LRGGGGLVSAAGRWGVEVVDVDGRGVVGRGLMGDVSTIGWRAPREGGCGAAPLVSGGNMGRGLLSRLNAFGDNVVGLGEVSTGVAEGVAAAAGVGSNVGVSGTADMVGTAAAGGT